MLRKTLAVLVTACLLGSCGEGSKELLSPDENYDRMIATDTIRAGYITYPPSFISDPNTGELSGISHDILLKVGENLGVKVEFIEELGWGSMIEAVDSGRIDIVATGIWPTAARGKRADFVTPIFYSYVKAYVREGDNRFDGNLSLVNSEEVTVAVIDGEMAAIISNSDFPNASQASLTQISDVSQLLLEVSSGKADITFAEPAIALEFMSKNPGKIKEVKSVAPLRLFPNSYVIKKGAYKLNSTLNVAIEELVNSGYVDKTIERYEKHDGSFGRASAPAD